MAGVNGLCAARPAMEAAGQGAGLVKEGQTALGAVLTLSGVILRSVLVSLPSQPLCMGRHGYQL